MNPIRVARGTGRGPTELAAYDAALAAAGVQDYNLVGVSSVVPAGAEVRTVDRLPELGGVGDRLTVVEAAAVGTERASAALAWGRTDPDPPSPADATLRGDAATDRGPGLFYETSAADGADREAVLADAETGLAAGADLREWELVDRERLAAGATAEEAPHVAAVVVAAFGSAESML